MSEEITKKLDEISGEEITFEEFVRRQFLLLHQRINEMETGLRTEMVERFVQVSRHVKEVKDELGKTNELASETKEDVRRLDDKMFKLTRQMRDLTDKVDLFVQEHLYLKRDVQDMQETLEQRH
jgi:methyl-accepting chemotaxis protein